ncbi:bifunctional DNA-binding transcriptional regulator/O6-methylguanine-DNA methyltransferase Ada [Buttiauxella selenatireducens]|uniref:Bifunctional DNA-binding transcriptional regulator/O6-methylguanine-DNA methyltransferase Ada n=1 Tax=Buttiauxella selenatireducens TaxID=3073902 RepID=A0ABY9S890_9ENTR|nr:bifunctional DNA-binding transcriptional regulator/O6-methylguanine-DNA methyltransferase Ada [Buttiauxella sp. R73]WMY73208.1 bifunctional DNA-binding transcriptional regulator/O6-methylguanine-DNA methyltransferase Ada [Buttiauxella sp. R73]
MNAFFDKANDESRWQAVETRDNRADGQFVFAVKTTGICCRPSCRARHPLRKNVLFFDNVAAAVGAGFRPCKRCQPDKQTAEQQRIARITQACRILESRSEPMVLAELAALVAMSPFHFHRLFKQVTGLTPHTWQKALRAKRLREQLAQGEPVTRAVFDAGYQSGSNYYQQADKVLGMTAKQYRQGGERTVIQFVVGSCRLGECLVAQSERGICAILLGNDGQTLVNELESLFPHSALVAGDELFSQRVARVVSVLEHPNQPFSLPLDIQGTAFQQLVWQALREIPVGQTASYRDIAQRIGKPQAVRAVAGACAANKLAVIIPCHRVVRNDGAISGYRWGVERKRQLLEIEAEQQEE